MKKSPMEIVDKDQLENIHHCLWDMLDNACIYLLENLKPEDTVSFTGKDKRIYTITVKEKD